MGQNYHEGHEDHEDGILRPFQLRESHETVWREDRAPN
jgi:hypothetical protein